MPDWVTSWYQLVVVQLAGLVALAISVWKWLTKPLREKQEKLDRKHTADFVRLRRALTRLKKAFEKDSFEIRTSATSILGKAVENEHRIEMIEHRLDNLANSSDRIQSTLEEGLREIRDRLRGVETELQVRSEFDRQRRNRQQGREL